MSSNLKSDFDITEQFKTPRSVAEATAGIRAPPRGESDRSAQLELIREQIFEAEMQSARVLLISKQTEIARLQSEIDAGIAGIKANEEVKAEHARAAERKIETIRRESQGFISPTLTKMDDTSGGFEDDNLDEDTVSSLGKGVLCER